MRKVIFLAALVLCVAPFAYGQCETLTFLTESLPTFGVDDPAHFDIEVIGGTAPYSLAVVEGAFPDNLHMNSSGKIRGKGREEAVTTVFVRVTDANGCMLTQAFNVLVEVL